MLLMAQTVIPNGAPPSHVFDGQIDEWKALAPTFVLRSTTGGRKAKVWVRQVPEGLLIAGEVLGVSPEFRSEESEILTQMTVWPFLNAVRLPIYTPAIVDRIASRSHT